MKKIIIPFLLFLFASISAHAGPESVTTDEVDGYKFGVEQGCRESASKAGRTWQQGDALCSCTMETLAKSFTFRDWQRAVKPDGVATGDVEKKTLLENSERTQKCIAARESRYAASGAMPKPPSLVGRWEWAMPNGCVEAYTFKPGGQLDISSAEEKTTSTYAIASMPEKAGRYKFSMKVLKDNGGEDCSKANIDDTGKSHAVFLMVNFDVTMFALCTTPDGFNCAGPMKRKRK